jgi:N-methylhydantoinase B
MMDEFALDDIEALADFVIDNSRAATEAAIAELPRGTFKNTLTLDGYDKPVTLKCALTVEDKRIVVDFSGSSPASPFGINVVLNYCKAYAAFGVRTIVAPDVPNNAGSLAPVEVTAPEGSIVNVERPWPVAARHIIGQFLPDVVLGALAKAVPERVPAEGAACLWGIQIRGGPEVAARVGRPGGNVSAERYEVLSFNSGGSGARPGLDGMSATAFPSGVRAMSSELFETLAPIVVWKKELRADSGGAGETRGGLGQTVEVGTLDGAPFALYAMFDRVDNPAKGRAGGANGAAGKVRLASGKALPAKGMHYIRGDDNLVVELPGGGGRGKALKRDPERVAADVADGYVSRKTARKAFGVALERNGAVDKAATKAQRAAIRKAK